jgi:hypothetical protein
MSWHFSQALVEDFSQASCLDGARFAPLRSKTMRDAYCWRDKTTESLDLFQYGMTSEPSTAHIGEELLTWYQAGSRVSTSALPAQCGGAPDSMGKAADSGTNICESLTNPSLRMFGGKILPPSKIKGLTESFVPFPSAGLYADGKLSELPIAAFGTRASAYGSLLPTPTARDWKDTPGMTLTRKDGKTRTDRLPMLLFSCVRSAAIECKQATPSAAQTVMVRGLTVRIEGSEYNPALPEWLMEWPIGWTELKPLAMDKYHEWRRLLFDF